MLYLKLGYLWLDNYYTLKVVGNQYPSFFSYLLNNLVYDLIHHNLFTLESGLFSRDIPVFFLFGVLFFSTVILSWFFFSYLGLYGIFKLNIVSLFFFLISLLYYSKFIFLDHKVYIIKLGS